MGNKRLYLLIILYITVYTIIIKLAYPELEITALADLE